MDESIALAGLLVLNYLSTDRNFSFCKYICGLLAGCHSLEHVSARKTCDCRS